MSAPAKTGRCNLDDAPLNSREPDIAAPPLVPLRQGTDDRFDLFDVIFFSQTIPLEMVQSSEFKVQSEISSPGQVSVLAGHSVL
jgi:hypothetical protein